MPQHDVVIYMPNAGLFYDGRATVGGGGAERQTWLLAAALARRGLRVAHIVFPVADPVIDPSAPVTLVQRPLPAASGTARQLAAESAQVWKALNRADARLCVFRGATAAVGVGGMWSRARRRRMVFAGANEADFTLVNFHGPRDPRTLLFRSGMHAVNAVVAQSDVQVELARRAFPKLGDVQRLPSFVEARPPAEGPGEAFLWVSRLTEYKRPLLYADLAAAVPEAKFWMIATRSDAAEHAAIQAELERRAAELPNLELLPQRTHAELQDLVGRAVGMVNTSSFEGVPNTWLEGWARGVPALTLSFDPDGRVAENGLGVAAGGDVAAFAEAARSLWARRADRGGFGPVVRAFVADAHGRQVEDGWAALVERLSR